MHIYTHAQSQPIISFIINFWHDMQCMIVQEISEKLVVKAICQKESKSPDPTLMDSLIGSHDQKVDLVH